MGEFEDTDSITDNTEIVSKPIILDTENSPKSRIIASVNNTEQQEVLIVKDIQNGNLVNGTIHEPSEDDLHASVPDGGLRAWLVMIGSFFCNGILFGIINSYSVIYFYLVEQLEESGNTELSSKAALVGSLTIGTTFFLSPVAGILTDRIGIRLTTFLGGALASGGMFVSSFLTHNVEALYLTYGVMFGIGASLAYTPSLVILGHYFKKYLGFVNGIVTAGSSIFTVLMPMFLDVLISNKGLEITLRLTSILVACVMLCALLFKPLTFKHPPAKEIKKENDFKKLINVDIWRNKKYVVWATAIPLSLFGYFVPYVHMYKFVKNVFPTSDGKLPVMAGGLTSGLGRLIFGYIADRPKVNRILLQQISFISIGSLTFLLPCTQHFQVLIVISLAMGLFDGCFISLLGPIAFDLCGKDGASQAIGFLLGFCSIPLTIGPPIAGMLYDHTGSYLIPFLLAGVPPLIGAAAMCLVRCVDTTNANEDIEQNGCIIIVKEEKPLMNDSKVQKSISLQEVYLASAESLSDQLPPPTIREMKLNSAS